MQSSVSTYLEMSFTSFRNREESLSKEYLIEGKRGLFDSRAPFPYVCPSSEMYASPSSCSLSYSDVVDWSISCGLSVAGVVGSIWCVFIVLINCYYQMLKNSNVRKICFLSTFVNFGYLYDQYLIISRTSLCLETKYFDDRPLISPK